MSSPSPPLQKVAVLGGTFSPVHHGHLRSALELVEHLQLQQVRLMPCAIPPHRDLPGCSAHDRASMVELAVAQEPRLLCDRRELLRAGPSYTIDSLIALRSEIAEASISLVMGCDALHKLDSWHRWRELLDWSHIVVIARPGWEFPREGVVASWLQQYRADSNAVLEQKTAGSVVVEQLRPLAISSTEIRQLLRHGRSVRYLLPDAVLDYIQTQGLYS